MRNWIADKFGRNRVRTPRAEPSPAPRPTPIQPISGHTTANGIQYWHYSSETISTHTYGGIDRGQDWITRIWSNYPAPPPFPEKLRLPEGV